MAKDRIRNTNPRELIAATILDTRTKRSIANTPIFWFGQVVENKDKENSNRIKVRVPLLDDTLYYDEKGKITDKGDDRLPWCVSALGRFVNTPEVNSVVLIGLLNPDTPFEGRIWFTAINDESSKELWSDLKPEVEGEKAWELVEKGLGFNYNYFPNRKGNKIPKKRTNTNFLVGIKGKSNNKLMFDKDRTILIQDESKDTESKLVLSKLVELKGKEIDILSTNSLKIQRPVFADPLFSYLIEIQTILTQITILLSSTPGTITLPTPGSPVGPSPAAAAIVSLVSKAQDSLTNLQIPGNGKSKYIKIN